MKKVLSCILALLLTLALCACGGEGGSATVQSVMMINGTGAAGFVNRCAGKIVSGQTAKITRDGDKKVLEVFVQVGDMVEEGSVLFSYDAEAMKLELEKKQLELQVLENTISSAESEIAELEKQSAKASSSDKLQYAIEIDTKKADIREATYNKALKEREIQSMEKSLEDTEVKSPISGRVMSINENAAGEYEVYGGDEANSAFITVMNMTSYRVQGTISELNLGTIREGMPVLIRSRMNASALWHGTVESIDWDNPVSNEQSMYYYGPSDEMTSASRYPFYIMLESMEGLILGEHVYIEPDFGQEDQSGTFLPAMYIVDADSNPWVWAANKNDKLEKRSVTLGEYDGELDRYAVVSGIEETDYLAFPDESLSVGMAVSYYGEATASDGNAEEPAPAPAVEVAVG